MTSYQWTGHYAENRPPVVWALQRHDWAAQMEDGREHALIDVLVKQFDQWVEMDGGPERARRVLAYLDARYRSTGVDNREGQA